MPLSIIVWLDIAFVLSEFRVFVLEGATALETVAKILTLCPLKLAPKSRVNVLPVGEPDNVKIASPSWLLPDKFKTSPTEPVPPEPVDIIVTEKSSVFNEANVSFVPDVIDISPFDDNVPVKFLLTLKLVSVTKLLLVVFSVLIVS